MALPDHSQNERTDPNLFLCLWLGLPCLWLSYSDHVCTVPANFLPTGFSKMILPAVSGKQGVEVSGAVAVGCNNDVAVDIDVLLDVVSAGAQLNAMRRNNTKNINFWNLFPYLLILASVCACVFIVFPMIVRNCS